MPETGTHTAACPECGMALASDAPRGICPFCLFKQALEVTGSMTVDSEFHERLRDAPPTPQELAADFPNLEIVRFIGRGGMGVVYEALDRQLDRKVALKILSPAIARDPAFAERFMREAKVMAKLTHPHVVGIYDFGKKVRIGAERDAPLCFFLMEFVDGLTLRQLLDSGELTPQQAFAIVPQICEALQYAHNKGVVHRDIKPENILMDRQGNVKIADFGLAKMMGLQSRDYTISTTGQVLGTLHYMAPEQMERPTEVDHRADIYSLGVVFYQMLTGELPLGRFAPPSRKAPVDARLDEVVLRALEKEPARRYQQASALQSQIESIAATPAGIPDDLSPPEFRQSWISDLTGALGTVGLAVFAILLMLVAGGIAFWMLAPSAVMTSGGTSTSTSGISLADQPQELRKSSTDRVIEAGIEKPISPWTWQELETRPLTSAHADKIMDGLTDWVRREHPRGMTQPLAWLDQFLKKLDQSGLIGEPRRISFLEAIHGDIRGDRSVRLREGSRQVTVHLEWRSTWHRELLGLALLNELQSTTVDGQPLPPGGVPATMDGMSPIPFQLPALEPGQHVLQFVVLSALVPSADLVGLQYNAKSTDWPPAKKRWTRTFDVEITVYSPDTAILSPSHDPSMRPTKHGLTIDPIMIRGDEERKNATLKFNIPPALPVPISFDVSLRIAGQTLPCGALWAATAKVPGTDDFRSTQSDTVFNVQLPPIGADVKDADVILTPNPNPIELTPALQEFWGGEIILEKVPFRRLDMTPKEQPEAASASNNEIEQVGESIQVGDSLGETIKKLAEHGIEVHDSTGDVEWPDGKARRTYRVSRSRNPDDALTLVALYQPDGRDTEIEEMYWDIDFIKLAVAKRDRPPAKHEPVERMQISQLISELNKVPR